jgi:hypothetical protein
LFLFLWPPPPDPSASHEPDGNPDGSSPYGRRPRSPACVVAGSSAPGDHAELLHQVEEIIAQPVLTDQTAVGSPDVVAVEADAGASRRRAARDAALIRAFGEPATSYAFAVDDRPYLDGESQIREEPRVCSIQVTRPSRPCIALAPGGGGIRCSVNPGWMIWSAWARLPFHRAIQRSQSNLASRSVISLVSSPGGLQIPLDIASRRVRLSFHVISPSHDTSTRGPERLQLKITSSRPRADDRSDPADRTVERHDLRPPR